MITRQEMLYPTVAVHSGCCIKAFSVIIARFIQYLAQHECNKRGKTA